MQAVRAARAPAVPLHPWNLAQVRQVAQSRDAGKKQYTPPRVTLREKCCSVLLPLPLVPTPGKVKELTAGSLMPKNTSCPLMLNVALPASGPSGRRPI
jgi:hypothetical protein